MSRAQNLILKLESSINPNQPVPKEMKPKKHNTNMGWKDEKPVGKEPDKPYEPKNEAIIVPRNTGHIIKKIMHVVDVWIERNLGRGVISTRPLVDKLIEMSDKHRLGVEFNDWDHKSHNPRNTHLVFTGSAKYRSKNGTVEIYMHRQADPDLVQRHFNRNQALLFSTLRHELIHGEQIKRNPSFFPRAMRGDVRRVLSGSHLEPESDAPSGYTARKHTVDPITKEKVKLSHYKTMARISRDKTPTKFYLGVPEEVMAHAKTVAELMKEPLTEPEAITIVAKYLAFGKDHPAYKRFMRHLVSYSNRDVGGITNLVKHAERMKHRLSSR